MESRPAAQSASTASGLLALLFRWTVPRAVSARIRRTASTSASANSSGSPSQPWPKLTTPSGTRDRCESATAASCGAGRRLGEPVVTGAEGAVGLERDAAHALRVARTARRERRFVPAEEEVLRGAAAVVERALLELARDAIPRQLRAPRLDPLPHAGLGETPRVLARVGVHAERARPVAAVREAHRRVREGRQRRRVRAALPDGVVARGVGGCQERGHRARFAAEPVVHEHRAAAREADRRAPRQREQVAAARQRDPLAAPDGLGARAALAREAELRMVVDTALGVCHQQAHRLARLLSRRHRRRILTNVTKGTFLFRHESQVTEKDRPLRDVATLRACLPAAPAGTSSRARSPRGSRSAGGAGLPVLDLAESNPTRAGLTLPGAALAHALAEVAADPASLGYEPDPRGDRYAREAIAAVHAAHGASVDPAHVILTAGTSEGYAHLFRLLADPGDRVHLPSPGYGLFEHLAGLEGLESSPYRSSRRGAAPAGVSISMGSPRRSSRGAARCSRSIRTIRPARRSTRTISPRSARSAASAGSRCCRTRYSPRVASASRPSRPCCAAPRPARSTSSSRAPRSCWACRS